MKFRAPAVAIAFARLESIVLSRVVTLLALAVFVLTSAIANACDFCVNGRWRPAAPVSHYTRQAVHCSGAVRHYYIAAECTVWNYAPMGFDPVTSKPLPAPWNTNRSYRKYRYYQYTDATFTKRVPQPAWLGILGPIIRGVVGDTIQVTFLNRTDRPLSIHPHGVRYDKENEGAYYFPNPGDGSVVGPGCRYTYVWHADKGAGPRPGEPSSKVWLYHSHVQGDAEINLGLVGAIVIADPAHARSDGSPSDVDREFVTLFSIFHEDAGLNGEMSEGMGEDDDPDAKKIVNDFKQLSPTDQQTYLQSTQKYSINGYIFGNLPGLDCRQGEHVRWYLLDVGSEQDLHTPHWHGETVLCDDRSTDVVELLPASMKIADMTAGNPGSWLFHCHVGEHMMSGMYANYRVHPARANVDDRFQFMKSGSNLTPPQPSPPGRELRDSQAGRSSLVVDQSAGAMVLGNVGAYHDFGWVNPLDHSRLACEFTLRNAGPMPLTIRGIDLPVACACTLSRPGEPPAPFASPLRIFPGERIRLALTLDVTRMNDGGFFKTVDVRVNVPSESTLSVELLGIIAPPLMLQPASVDFGDVHPVGGLKTSGADMTLDMDPRLAVGDSKIRFTNVNDDLVIEEIGKPRPADDPRYVRQRYRLSVKPDATIERFTDVIALKTSNTTMTARISEELSERGTFAVVQANVVGDFTVDQAGIAFGAVALGTGAGRDITITAFTRDILPTPSIASDSPLITIQIQPGADKHDEIVHVRLSPNAPAGNFSAHLTITSRAGARAVLPVVAFVR